MPEQLELTPSPPPPAADTLANVFTPEDLRRVVNALRWLSGADPRYAEARFAELADQLERVLSLRPEDDQLILLPIAGPVLDALVGGLAAEHAHVSPARGGVALLYYRGWRLGCRPPVEESA